MHSTCVRTFKDERMLHRSAARTIVSQADDCNCDVDNDCSFE